MECSLVPGLLIQAQEHLTNIEMQKPRGNEIRNKAEAIKKDISLVQQEINELKTLIEAKNGGE